MTPILDEPAEVSLAQVTHLAEESAAQEVGAVRRAPKL